MDQGDQLETTCCKKLLPDLQRAVQYEVGEHVSLWMRSSQISMAACEAAKRHLHRILQSQRV